MKICFIDYTPFKYSYYDNENHILRGAEKVLINLSYNLSLLDNSVYVFNNNSKNLDFKNYYWRDINDLKFFDETFDVAISNGNINHLNLVKAHKKYAISYSIQTLEKFIRKNQLVSYIKNKPKIIFIGNYHNQKRNLLTKIFGYDFLDLAVDDIFLKKRIDLNRFYKSNYAIFTSRFDRNGQMLVDIWKRRIFQQNKNIKLLITPPKSSIDYSKFNIFNRKMKHQSTMIDDLYDSRMMLVPGHKAELYCLAAEEAKKLCIPVVTLGIGSLKERVVHNETGFIAKNDKEFSHYAIELFTNEILWKKIRNNLYKVRNDNNWYNSATKFLNVLKR